MIVDASVVVKWIKSDEKDSSIAFSLYEKHRDGVEQIIVPQLIFYEVANYLVTKSHTSEKNIEKALHFLFLSDLKIYKETEKEVIHAAFLAKKFNTSFYDMIYAELARRKRTVLITADEKFVAKTKFKFVKLLSKLPKK